MPKQPWDTTLLEDGTSHEDWLRENAPLHTLNEIAERLGRSEPSVRWKLKDLGLKPKRWVTTAEGSTVEGIPKERLLSSIKDKPRGLNDLSMEFDRSEATLHKAIESLKKQSYEITETISGKLVWSTKAPGVSSPPRTLWDAYRKEITFGAIGDTQFGSKCAQPTALRRCVAEMYASGVRDILVPGDIVAGDGRVYRGQDLDLVTREGDRQVRMAELYWPAHDGLRYKMMGGNHDWSFIRSAGFNPVRELARRRDDMDYIGFDLVDQPIMRGDVEIDARIWHPRGGVPYAVSYRAQKQSEQTAFEELFKALEKGLTPRIRFLLVGHLHIFMNFWAGPIFVAQVGCFEGKTQFLKRGALTPHIGGLIIDCAITDTGLISDLNLRFLRFSEIEEDWTNYPIPEEQPDLETLFTWSGVKGEEE